MKYREMTLAFVVVAVMATVMAFSGSDPIGTEQSVTTAGVGSAGSPAPTAYLGLVAHSLDAGPTRGTLVSDVLGNGPAGKAGIRRGDVIVTFDGRPVNDGFDLQRRVEQARPGTTVVLELSRGGRNLVVTVELEERPARIALAGLRAATVPS